jgi:enoyl-[acyl-carrier-protein] reductase (NADH)
VAVEIKTWLAKEFQTEGISVGEISPSSISTLAKRIVVTSKLLHAKFKEKSEEAPTARIRVVAV